MATATPETDSKEFAALVSELAKGPKLLASLPKAMQDVEFLENAIAAGRIMLGRPEHSWEHAPGIAESHSERPRRLIVSATINWTALDQPWAKSVYELLAEEETTDQRLRLQVKLARRAKAN